MLIPFSSTFVLICKFPLFDWPYSGRNISSRPSDSLEGQEKKTFRQMQTHKQDSILY